MSARGVNDPRPPGVPSRQNRQPPSGLHYMQLSELARLLEACEISPVEVTQLQLDRIGALDDQLNSYALVTAEAALEAAKSAETSIAAGRYRGVLHGVPLGVKDLFWTRGIPTTGGMPMHRSFRPVEDATVVARLREAGAVLLGKLQMTEGAYSDHHPAVTPPRNPWNAEYWPGISSSGPAVATAAGLCYGAVASDTGGSIRWPCNANGLTGLKPTWGRVSRFGMMELAASLDHVGPIARSARDVAAIFAIVAGRDERDPTSLLGPRPLPATSRFPVASSPPAASKPRAASNLSASSVRDTLRVGIDPRWNSDDVDPSVQRVLSVATEVFRALGCEIVEVSTPEVSQSVIDWAPACAVEAAVAHEATYPARRSEYGNVLASVLETGRSVSVLEYQKIRLRRIELRARFAQLLEDIDVLLAPVQPFAPLDLATIRTLGTQPELILKLQRFTAPFDLTGHPTMTLPGGFSEAGLPIGFQLIAAQWAEGILIDASIAFQDMTDWHTRHPPDRQAIP
jgi:amidase